MNTDQTVFMWYFSKAGWVEARSPTYSDTIAGIENDMKTEIEPVKELLKLR